VKARIFANIGCWLLIFPLVFAVTSYPFWVWHIWRTYTDGNFYSDPVDSILSYLTPIAVVGVVGLAALFRYGLTTKTCFVLGAATVLLLTLAPLVYVIWLWHSWKMHFSISYLTWWLNPVAILWLSAYALSLITLRAGFARKSYRFIHFVCLSIVLLCVGAALAWLFVTNDFSFGLINCFAVIPLTVACVSVIRLVFIGAKRYVALYDASSVKR